MTPSQAGPQPYEYPPETASTSSDGFYDRFAFAYPLIDVLLRPQKRKFFQVINGYPHGKLLEIGVGNGVHFKYYNNHDVIGIDTSRQMLSRARSHLRNNIQLFRMSGEHLSFPDGSFDYVVLSHVIAVTEKPEVLLGEVRRILRPHGKLFILNHFTPDNPLKYIDQMLQPLARLLQLNSVFGLSKLNGINSLKLISEANAGLFSYFKILIYEKTL